MQAVQKKHGGQEIGQPRGGPSTKVHAVVDEQGLPVDVALTGGEVSDYQPAAQQLEGKSGRWVIADRGYDGDRIISLIEEQGSEPVIPPRQNRNAARAYDFEISKQRHTIEFFLNRIKQYRRVATRYEKTACNYLAMIHIACIRLWSAF
jgi:transposase